MKPTKISPVAPININPADLEDLACVCGGKMFVTVFGIKVLPSLLSPNGQAGIVESPFAKVCMSCNTVWSIQDILKSIQKKDSEKPLIIKP